MKKYLIKSSALALSVVFLGACQGMPLRNQTPSSPSNFSYAQTLPSDQEFHARILTGPRLKFDIHFPRQSRSDFSTQALDCTAFAKAKISVRGVGITETLYPAAANAENHFTVPITGCSLSVTVPNVPSGENRVAEIKVYNSDGNEIRGTTLSATFDITANPTTVQMSYRSTPAGQIIGDLLTQNQDLLASEIDTNQLQTLIDQITGASGTYPNFSYITHPLLVNRTALVQDLIAQSGNLALLNPTNANYKLQPGRLSGNVTGLLGNDTYTFSLDDPVSSPITKNNGMYEFNQLPPGVWNYKLTWPAQYSSDPNPNGGNSPSMVGVISVSTGQEINLGTVTLYLRSPDGVSVSNIANDRFDLNWNAVPGATAYKVYKNGVLYETVNAPGLTSTITGLNPAQVYNMTVSAVVGEVESSPSPVLSVTTASNWSSWSQLGPSNENVLSLAAVKQEPNLVYFGAADDGNPSEGPLGGIWKCNNGTCNNVKPGSETSSVQALAIHPNNAQIVYAGTLSQGIFRSQNGGITWTQINTGLDANHLNIKSLVVDPAHPTHVYAGVARANNAQVYFSSNGGDSWTLASTGLPSASLSSISSLAIFNPPAPADALVYAGTLGGGVYRATGGNAATINWQPINNGLPTFGGLVFLAVVDVRALATHPVLSERLFGAGTGGCFTPFICASVHPFPGGVPGGYLPGVWRRIEGDADGWRQLGHNGTNAYAPATLTPSSTGLTQMDVNALSIDPVTPDTMYAATTTGIFRSINGGLNWSTYNTGLSSALQINAIVTQPQALWIGTEAGLYRAQ